MNAVVAPVDHKYDDAELAVRVTKSPEQKVVAPLEVIVGAAGSGFTVTVVAALAVL